MIIRDRENFIFLYLTLKLNFLCDFISFLYKTNMYRHRDNDRGRGFVFGIRSVVLRDNDGGHSDFTSNAYARHSLYSFNHIKHKEIKIHTEKQNQQIEYRNLFHE